MKSVSIGSFGLEMFTRRTATVTISAPDASTAAAFSSRLLYLPVPTISRDVKVRPATVQLSGETDCGAFNSASSNKMHDLERIAVSDGDLAQSCARDDLEIALTRALLRVETQLTEHRGDAESAGHSPPLTVNLNNQSWVVAHGRAR